MYLHIHILAYLPAYTYPQACPKPQVVEHRSSQDPGDLRGHPRFREVGGTPGSPGSS